MLQKRATSPTTLAKKRNRVFARHRAGSRKYDAPALEMGLPRRPLRVLVVEDEGRLRDAAAEFLSHRGMIVRKAARPAQIMRAVQRFKPDVMILDDYFERSGVKYSSLMPHLLGKFPSMKIIVSSSKDGKGRAMTANPLNWGATDVVSKTDMMRGRSLDRSVVTAAAL